MATVDDRCVDTEVLRGRLAHARHALETGRSVGSVLDYLDHCLEREMGIPSSGLLWADGSPFCGLADEVADLYAAVRAAMREGGE